MARRITNDRAGDPKGDDEALPACSICEGRMILAYDRYQQKVCVCSDCNTSISIPGAAWDVANAKRASQVNRGPDRRRQYRRASDTRMQ